MWNTGALQHWAHLLGIGRPTGIDLPEQTEGLLPSKPWRNQLYREGETERPWSAGDNVQLATGQGDLQTNPLQMAIAYATVANGGTVVTPHVGMEIDDSAGRVLKEFDPPPRRHVHVDPTYRAAILEGLHEAAQTPGGTSYGVFGGFPVPVAGKTGTAQRPPNADQSWYVVLAPYPNPRIVTAVTIEQGGFGAESAAPAGAADPRGLLQQARDRRPPAPTGGARADVRDPRPPRPRRAVHDPAPASPSGSAFPTWTGRWPSPPSALVAFSVFTLGQATSHDVPGNPTTTSTGRRSTVCSASWACCSSTRIDYSRFRELRVGIYTFLCVSISLVFVFGFAARGSRRSFELPFFSFQPSELGKLLLVLALAGFVIDGARRGSARQRTVRYLCLGLAPAALVFLQPDLGTALVFAVATLAVMYVGGVRWTHFAVIGAALVALVTLVLVVAPAVGTPVLKGYQEQRLTSFLHPSEDPSDAGYQQHQAKIAIGSGEKTGRGDQATQTRLDFVPERHTDFIFAVIGERYGFVGAAFVLSLYALLIWRALRIVTLSKNSYGTLVAGGIAGIAAVPGLRQRGNEPRDHADHRDPLTADELRRFLRARDFPGGRSSTEHSHASAAQPEGQVRLVTPRKKARRCVPI